MPKDREGQIDEAVDGILDSVSRGEELESLFDKKVEYLPEQNYKGFKIKRIKVGNLYYAAAFKVISNLYPKTYDKLETGFGTEHEVGKEIRKIIDVYAKRS